MVGNWHAIMRRQKTLTFFTAGYNQAAVISPYAILARPFFTGQIQLRHHHADGRRLWAGANLTLVLRQCLCAHC
ncbi:MAG: hypothetical protein F9K20_02620 [Hyphomicrobium sp.]|nr:MAG: hypothetical protein F9K20_02620 [Hyphomicrobium sp.]